MNFIQSYVFMDLETTGIPSHENNKTRITEISFVAVKRSHILETKCGLTPRVQNKLTLCLNPRKLVDPGSTETTGLCNDLLEFEPTFNLQVFAILDNFMSVLSKPVCLIAQNGLYFDYPILKKQLDDLKVNFQEDLLCADSFHAFYDIMKANETGKKLNEDVPNILESDHQTKALKDSIDQPDTTKEPDNLFTKSDCMDMQKRNETTPKQQIIKTNYTPSKEKAVTRAPSKARRKFPWSVGDKPKVSYKLKDIYERLLNRPALNAHRAEADCIMTLECAVVLSKQFVEWVEENHVFFKDVKPMTIGVPLGPLVLVAALWGITNPFIKRGTKGLKSVTSRTPARQFYAEVTYLLYNWKYVVPWLINQSGSLLFVVSLGRSALSLSAPLANGLTIVFTALTSSCLREEPLTMKSLFGIALILFGTTLCYLDKS